MLYAKIKHTNLYASRLVLGTDTFGTQISEEESFKMMDRYVCAGGNMLDTASVYADWLEGRSISEKTIGKWLASNNCRDDLIIATKGGHYDLATCTSRLHLTYVREDFESSLENLQTDRIDLYWLHKDDPNQQPEALIEILNEAVSNKAQYFGVSNWTYDRIKQANDHAAKNALRPIIASQILHSIAQVNETAYGILAMDKKQYLQYCADDLNVFAYASQAKGFFLKLAQGVDTIPSYTKDMYWNDYNIGLFHRLNTLASEKNVSVSGLVLAALICDDKVNTFAQIGPRNLMQLESALKETDLRLTNTELDYLFGANA